MEPRKAFIESKQMKRLSKTERQFLELLRCGLWGDRPDTALIEGGVDWAAVYRMALRQTVVGVVYDGIALLPKELMPSRNVILKWYGAVVQIEQANRRLNSVLWELAEKCAEADLRPVLLKGQGVAQYYREPLHRQSGDIDLFCPGDYERANAVIATWDGAQFEKTTTYHANYRWHGTELENHRVYVNFYSKRNRRKLAEFLDMVPLAGEERLTEGDRSIRVPVPQMNVVYIFLHLLHHFLQVGVGLRQVCDWLCVIQARGAEIDVPLFERSIDLLPIRRAMTALWYVGTRYLGMPPEALPLKTAGAEKDGELLLRDIMDMGNFGHDTDLWRSFSRGKHLHNLGAYSKALRRHARIYRFCPNEVRAYPVCWLKEKFGKGE